MFCQKCGTQNLDDASFCVKCGNNFQSIKPEFEKKPINETSRLSGLGIEKYLIANEIITYATTGSLYVGNVPNFKGIVTNNRIIFYKREGFIIKNDILNEIPLDQIKSYKIVEEGLIFKNMYFQLNELKIKGERGDILELYKAIQTAKLK
ncbi:MAG: zinc-ribbon domain-containing protein [Candidatus Methanoperedens sp.]|nr:zinc-ribbon domain-containing protein [Candidatus Methanoperedens sp.]